MNINNISRQQKLQTMEEVEEFLINLEK